MCYVVQISSSGKKVKITPKIRTPETKTKSKKHQTILRETTPTSQLRRVICTQGAEKNSASSNGHLAQVLRPGNPNTYKQFTIFGQII